MKVAWICEYPASAFADRPLLRSAPPSHPVPWIVEQAPRVAAAGVELHILTVSKHIAADDEFERGGIHFHFLKIPPVPRAAMAYQLDRARLTACLRRIAPDLVQGFGTESSFGYTAVTSPFPSVLMIQGIIAKITHARGRWTLLREPALAIALLFERWTIQRARHVICETQFAAEFVRQLNPRAVTHLVRTPIRDAWFDIARVNDVERGPEVLFVGWVVPAKGVDVLIAAFEAVAAAIPGSSLHVVGAIDARFMADVLGPAATRLGLTDRIYFHGGQPAAAVADRMARASVLALPTRMDTAPNVLAEARAAGVPIVASAVGGVPELIDDGVDGVLVEVGSSASLGQAIVDLLRDPVRASAMAARGRERVVRDHQLLHQVPKLLGVYRDVLASWPGAA